MAKKKKGDIGVHLTALNTDLDKKHPPAVMDAVIEQRKKRLVFSESGELIITDEPEADPNSVVVDQIYKDGFFCLN